MVDLGHEIDAEKDVAGGQIAMDESAARNGIHPQRNLRAGRTVLLAPAPRTLWHHQLRGNQQACDAHGCDRPGTQ